MLGLPENISTYGQRIDDLILYIHVLMFVLFIGWGLFYVYALWRFRSGNHPKADYHGVKSHASSYLEVTVALVEVILLIGFSIPIYKDVVSAFPAEADSLQVRVFGQQFQWMIQYPGPDGKLGKVVAKLVDPVSNPNGIDKTDPNAQDDFFTFHELHVPKDKPVIVRVVGWDVIHNFAVPNLRIKQDAIPGMEFPVWFSATKEGSFDIACSQLCGSNHYAMKGTLVVEATEAFDAWTKNFTPEVNNLL